MAIVRRHKSTIYGLTTDLTNLGTADTNETSARIQGDLNLQTNIDAEATARTTAISNLTTTVSGHTTDITALQTSMTTVQGDASTAGSIAKAQADAQAYTDTRETAITTAYQLYADTAEADAITTSNSYTDTAVAGLATTAYVDTAEADAITAAATNVNNLIGDGTVNGTAGNTVTDRINSAVAGLASEAYADQAEADAKAYTDTRETAITTSYQSYADTAEADAITDANTYTDGQIATVNTALDTKLTASNNLSDVTNVVTARTNLEIYSSAEVDAAITAANLAQGTNYSVADHTAKDALTGLTVGDNVFVADDGDTKWAVYKVMSVTDGAGSTSTYEKIMDKDVYLNAISAESVKAAYEGNADTNAFTDAEKAQLATNTTDIATIDADSSTIGSFRKGDADTLTSAQSYTDTQIAALNAANTTYVDQAESDAIATANAYTDSQVSGLATTAYVDQAEADAITSANGNTASLIGDGTVDGTAGNTVKDRIDASLTSAQTYADTAEADAITTANAYTNTRETAITTAYQSYADQAEADAITTANSYTDSEIATLSTTVSGKLAIANNLSDLNNVATARTNLGIYSTSEVDAAIATATSNMLAIASESLVVSGDLITLTNAPANGVILNYATVRYIDENGNAFDIPVSVTATPGGKEFELSGDSTGEFDTKTVKVQYMYVA